MENKKFALIGKTLKHSYSKIIHGKLGDYPYELVELNENELSGFVSSEIAGFNVTIPYKKEIMPLLDQIDETAKNIGAVNTVVKRDGKVCGYNTDFYGMIYMLSRAKIGLADKNVMILGSGGTSNTARAVAKHLNAKSVVVVSRTGDINYQNCYDYTDTEVIINTTPVGMYPNVDNSPVDLDRFFNLSGVADVIYNPSLTQLLYKAKQKGIKYTSGLPMLVAQAKYAKDIFFNEQTSDDIIEKVLNEIEKETQNLVLIGMPGSGKSSIGKRLSELLGREFIDTDIEIEKIEKRSIKEIFAKDGEGYFRKIESQVLKDACMKSGKIIATGGGVVKNKDNYFYLKQNGKIIYIIRPICQLAMDGRPLSKNIQALEKLYEERKDAYEKFADYSVENSSDISVAVVKVMELL